MFPQTSSSLLFSEYAEGVIAPLTRPLEDPVSTFTLLETRFGSSYSSALNQNLAKYSQTETPLEETFLNRQTTLSSFFAMQMVDIPAPFLKLKSLFSLTARLPKHKLVTLLMRHGQRHRIVTSYSRSLQRLSSEFWALRTQQTSNYSWQYIYTIFNQVAFLSQLNISKQSSNAVRLANSVTGSYPTTYLNPHTTSNYTVASGDHLQHVLFEEFEKFIPLFSFFLTKVDKQKRKHSRGKSGKYQVIWKYVPRYKRLLTVLRWLSKDTKFQRAKTIEAKLYQSLRSFLFDNQSHLIPQLRRFVHSFVFQHHRKTLVRTLKASS